MDYHSERDKKTFRKVKRRIQKRKERRTKRKIQRRTKRKIQRRTKDKIYMVLRLSRLVAVLPHARPLNRVGGLEWVTP